MTGTLAQRLRQQATDMERTLLGVSEVSLTEAKTMREAAVLSDAVTEWRDARRAFLALPPNDPTTRAALDRLANAEHALMKGPAQ
jgi:hypothetical protein